MTEKISSRLLPVGFYDLLCDEAQQSHRNVNKAIDFFLDSGYKLIKTPLVEFADNFSKQEIADAFVVLDRISGKNLLLRNDITLQIVRLIETRLKNIDLPLKLCYVGDVLITSSNELYADRQSTQVGLEIIGSDDEESDFEIIKIILQILSKLLLQNLLIEFSIPNFSELFLHELGLANDYDLRAAISQKNLSQINKLAPNYADLIAQIMLTNNNLDEISKKILHLTNSQQIVSELKRAKDASDFIARDFPNIRFCCDLFGDKKSSYHRNLAFDIFCGDFSYPIAIGGRYKIKDKDAVGATIYMNRLRKI